ncbi:helix-hairpin-helix domain-containing protein [Natronomonas sp.]|uniref:helix-hairpin-helix domain-containing protein n=1 Tax=Natronomonas sp. TaxID=2184060 RepID=UPI00260D658C|nr:helix-hairpin-helix domain-containing protein [Natronomonas sp.]
MSGAFDDLTAIDGVGEKTAARLAELDDPAAALAAGDVSAIARAPGISDGRAARIVRAAIRHRHGDEGSFLATDRARELYESVLGLLEERAVTEYGRKRLRTFYPSASADRIAEVRAMAEAAVEREPTPELIEALSGVEPLEPPRDVRVRDRCLATNDAETFSAATEAVPEMSVELVDNARAIADLARGYSTVIVLDEAFSGVEIDGDVRVRPEALRSPASVVPERTLAFFARNRDRIRAAAAVHRAAGADAGCDLAALEAALERLGADGTVAGDDRLEGLEAALDDLEAAVSMAEGVANDRLRAAIEERDVTIEGTDLLSLVERGAGVDSLLERELDSEFADAIEAARTDLVETLGVTDHESLARRVFTEEPTYPVERDERVVERLREELTAERDRRGTRLKRELAEELGAMREPAEKLVGDALEIDVELAVSRFAEDFECAFPTIEGRGVSIEGGRSPLLDVPFEAVEAVDYAVEGVSLLSGVNSGGKTSTLDLVGAVVVLAQMGLPVPAERVRTERFEALHYQAKSQGTLDAGAFESTLREFGSLVEGDRTRLVLVDELESITEPGASAVIIAGILEALTESDSTAVFVSHLAGEIREAAAVDVNVDGIEAVGLKDGELRVNRSPVKDHLARSTPELIVEKLAERETSGFYAELLEKFDSPEAG